MPSIKITLAIQGNGAYQHRNLKRKMLDFSELTRHVSKHLIPKFARIKMPNTSPEKRITIKKSKKLRV
jgi:hypothetical protein